MCYGFHQKLVDLKTYSFKDATSLTVFLRMEAPLENLIFIFSKLFRMIRVSNLFLKGVPQIVPSV